MIVAVGINEGRRTFFVNLTAQEVGSLTAGVVMKSDLIPGFPEDIEICITTMSLDVFHNLLPSTWVTLERAS